MSHRAKLLEKFTLAQRGAAAHSLGASAGAIGVTLFVRLTGSKRVPRAFDAVVHFDLGSCYVNVIDALRCQEVRARRSEAEASRDALELWREFPGGIFSAAS
eukprot:7952964-Pyramimonas_sp.AAC.1